MLNPATVSMTVGKARELGAGEEDIQAAIEVGYMVENGASTADTNCESKTSLGGRSASRFTSSGP